MPRVSRPIELIATGDLGPCRSDATSIFEFVRDRLHAADLVLGQLEPVLTDRGTRAPQARLAMRSPPNTAQAIRAAGFDVVSFASNHCMDWGSDGLLDTVDALRRAQIDVIGAGKDIEAARRPAIVTFDDTCIALLAYNSILPMGYWAEPNRAGCAPLRAWTHYEQIEHDQPGTPSRVHSFPNGTDVADMAADIARIRQQVELVVLSIHWGIHFVPAVIGDYQRELAHAAIDAGADIVIGHHPHVLKGIEVYKGKVIFYSLGNFAIDPPTSFQTNLTSSRTHKEIVALNPTWRGDDQKQILPASCKTMVAKVVIENRSIKAVSALPAYINDDSQPVFLRSTDRHFREIADHVQEITQSQRLNGAFNVLGDELIIQ